MMKLRRKRKAKRKGASAVEFAVIAPFLVVMIFGMIECSRILMALHAATGAAREATRAAIVQDATDEQVRLTAVQYLETSAFNGANVQVVRNEALSSVDGMRVVSVRVTMNFDDVSILGNPLNFTINGIVGNAAMLAVDE